MAGDDGKGCFPANTSVLAHSNRCYEHFQSLHASTFSSELRVASEAMLSDRISDSDHSLEQHKIHILPLDSDSICLFHIMFFGVPCAPFSVMRQRFWARNHCHTCEVGEDHIVASSAGPNISDGR